MNQMFMVIVLHFFGKEGVLSANTRFYDLVPVNPIGSVERSIEHFLDGIEPPAYCEWAHGFIHTDVEVEWKHSDDPSTYTRLFRGRTDISKAASGQMRVTFVTRTIEL